MALLSSVLSPIVEVGILCVDSEFAEDDVDSDGEGDLELISLDALVAALRAGLNCLHCGHVYSAYPLFSGLHV